MYIYIYIYILQIYRKGLQGYAYVGSIYRTVVTYWIFINLELLRLFGNVFVKEYSNSSG